MTKNKLALATATLTMAGALLAPLAQAADSKAERVADAAARKTEALESQMQQMAEQMQAMQAELSRVKSSSATSATANAKVQELDQWMASVKAAPEASHSKDNLVVVRGGWSSLDHSRGAGNTQDGLAQVGTEGGILNNNGNNEGYYYGGAFDFNVNNDLFGLLDDTSFAIELGVDYSSYGQGHNVVTDGAVVPVGTIKNGQTSTDARLRVSASPKIKFFHGSKFRPWLIPVGLDINVLGVPTNAVSVLSSGMQFGVGAEYDLFRGIVVGADTRYHYSTSKLDGTPVDAFTAGGYVGFKF